MAAYYKKIKGKRLDSHMITMADRAVKGRGDGRISLADAKKLLHAVKDSKNYTEVEKATMRHIRDKYRFSGDADKWFRSQVRSWAAAKSAAAPRTAKKAPAKAREIPSRERREFPENIPAPRLPAAGEKKGRFPKKAALLVLLLLVVAGALFYFFPGLRSLYEREGGVTAPETKAENVLSEEEALKQGFYIVKYGDTLIRIAEHLTGDYRNWKSLFEANRDVLKSPVLIFPGQRLKIAGVIELKKDLTELK